MSDILVACETIEDEVKAALKSLNLDYEVIWLEGGLHSSPDRLRRHIQGLLDEVDGRCRRLIFTLGHCGGGLSDLSTGDYETVLPLADDCLSLLLGSMNARRKASDPPTFFLTAGWMRHENSVVTSAGQAVEKYGRARADRLNKMMLKHYKRFGLVDTGVYDLKEAAAKVKPLAATADMEVESLPADEAWLRQLLLGPYDDPERFILLPPHSRLNFDSWRGILERPS